MFLDLQMEDIRRPWQIIQHHYSIYQSLTLNISFLISSIKHLKNEIILLGQHSTENHKQFLRYRFHFRTCLIDQSLQFLKIYRNLIINFQVLDPYDKFHFSGYIQFPTLILKRIYKLIFHANVNVKLYNQKVHRFNNIP